MRPITSNWRSVATAICVIVISGVANAEEAVLRISDAATRPGVVSLKASPPDQTSPGVVQLTSAVGVSGVMMPAYATPVGYLPGAYCPGDCCPSPGCTDQAGCCNEGCDGCACGDRCCGDGCSCGCCYGPGYESRMVTLFAKPLPKNCNNGRYPKRLWRGHQMNYLARNQRLANCLFGWMVPSGCAPPVGCYKITYADQPGARHPQDGGMVYGAQGYGTHVSVPLPPNVHYSYNYSWGTPASRLTPVGHYTPGAAPQSVYHRSW